MERSHPSAMGRRRDMGSEALEKCYNVHHGLLRRLRVVVVVDNNSTRDLRQKPYQVAYFGEGIALTNFYLMVRTRFLKKGRAFLAHNDFDSIAKFFFRYTVVQGNIT